MNQKEVQNVMKYRADAFLTGVTICGEEICIT